MMCLFILIPTHKAGYCYFGGPRRIPLRMIRSESNLFLFSSSFFQALRA